MIICKSGCGYLKWFYKSAENYRVDSRLVVKCDTLFAKRIINNYWYMPACKEKSVTQNKKMYTSLFSILIKNHAMPPKRGSCCLLGGMLHRYFRSNVYLTFF